MEHSKPHPAFKVWMETDDGYVFGPGVYSLLKRIMEVGTLKEAATELGMSYRYAWGLIKKAEEKLGEPLLTAHKGGRSGGGGAELTERGKQFPVEFHKHLVGPIDHDLADLRVGKQQLERTVTDQVCQRGVHHPVTSISVQVGLGSLKRFEHKVPHCPPVLLVQVGLILHLIGDRVDQEFLQLEQV